MTVESVVGFAVLTGLVVGACDWFIRLWLRRQGTQHPGATHLKTVEQLHNQLQQLQEEKHQTASERNDALRQADQAATERAQALKERDAARQERDAALAELEKTQAGLSLTEEERVKLEKQRRSLERRARHVLELGGQFWSQAAMKGAPPFRPLHERRMPIISLLNLKGGVGKTTLTAYLAWGLAQQKRRVLLVDLDLQGSLSALYIDGAELACRERDGLNLRHFLEAAAHSPRTRLMDYARGLENTKGCALLGTTDKHAYSEMNLTFRWLLRMGHPTEQWNGRRDARFLLRRGLHTGSLSRKFDCVLLDCPPLINLSCVNALVASDYVLIPSTCGRKATERVPPLIRRLKEIRDAVNPALQVLGLVANRTRGEEGLNAVEQTRWNALEQHAKDELGLDVYTFKQPVPDRAQIRDAEDTFVPPLEGTDLHRAVLNLAAEFLGRLPR